MESDAEIRGDGRTGAVAACQQQISVNKTAWQCGPKARKRGYVGAWVRVRATCTGNDNERSILFAGH